VFLHNLHPRGVFRRVVALLAVLAVMTFVVTACSNEAKTAASGAGAQTLRFGLSAEPVAPVAGALQGTVANMMYTLIHRGLMAYDSSGALIPALAESVKTPDAMTYVFTLRPNLIFQDGTPLTATNVKNSIAYYANPANGSGLYAGLKDIASITPDGDKTVTIVLTAPNSAFLQFLAVPTAAIIPDSSLNSKTPNWVGVGPFKLTSQESGRGLVLQKFDGYYGESDVKLNEIDFAYYADGEARTNALLSGDVDMIDYVPWENFDRVSAAPGIKLDAQAGPFQYVQFNISRGPFTNPKVREAVAYALNRNNSVKAAFQNHGKPLYGIVISENDPAYNADRVKLWDYNPTKAKQLLAEAGFPTGFTTTLLATSQYAFLQDTALAVQQDLKAIGIEATLDAPDWATRLTKGRDGDYDLAVSGDAGIITDPSYFLPLVTGPNTPQRSFDYNNPHIARLIDDGLRTTDPVAKRAAWDQAQSLIASDVPIATLTTRDQAYAFRQAVTGFKNLPGFLTFYSGYSLVNTSITK